MILADCTYLHVSAAARIKSLREAAGFSQEKLATRTENVLGRIDVVKLEGGQNKGTSDRTRAALAKAFGLSRDEMTDYLDGRLSFEDAVGRMLRPAVVGPSLAETVATHPGRWSVDVVRVVEGAKYNGGAPGDSLRSPARHLRRANRADGQGARPLADERRPAPGRGAR